jgi:hypothetical protein
MSDENLNNSEVPGENTVALDDQLQQGNEIPEGQEEVKENEEPQAETTLSHEDMIKQAQERAGKKIAAQRKLYTEQMEQLRQENERLKQERSSYNNAGSDQQNEQQYDPNRMIFDPKTNRYYSFDDPNPAAQAIAATVWREQQAAVISKQMDTKKVYEETGQKIVAGFSRFDDFEDAFETFKAVGTDDVAASLASIDDPAKVVHYLGNNPQELEKLTQLPPHLIGRRIWELEGALKDQKKMVSKASTPISTLGEPTNRMRPPETQSYEERAAFWRNELNPEK